MEKLRLRRVSDAPDPTMTHPFGKFVTVVKRPKVILGKHLFVSMDEQEWCRDNIGRKPDDWDYYVGSNTFVFSRAEDATLFKLRFGICEYR